MVVGPLGLAAGFVGLADGPVRLADRSDGLAAGPAFIFPGTLTTTAGFVTGVQFLATVEAPPIVIALSMTWPEITI